jgi:biotin transport system substrate-specific component
MRTGTRVLSLDGSLSMAFSLLIALGAKLRLPWDPVPFTLQTLFVLLAGVVLGARFGALSVVWYIAIGASGVPLFAGTTAGLGYLCGPTAGYLVGFAVAAGLVGHLVGCLPRLSFWRLALIMGSASGVILLCGALWLALGMGMGLVDAVRLGVAPFLPGDALKSLLAAAVVLPILRWRLARGEAASSA